MLMSRSLLERQEVTETALGTQTLAAAILRSSFYHKDTGADKCYLGVLLLAY